MLRSFARSTPYWIWLHVLAIELAVGVIVALGVGVFAAGAPPPESGGRVIVLIWFVLLPAFAYAMYRPPYRWFWLAFAGALVVIETVAFLGFVLPLGQLQFWLAAQIGAPWAGARFDGIATGLAQALLLALIVAHLRQLARAGVEAPYHGRYSRLGVALGAAYAALLSVLTYFWRSDLDEAPSGGPAETTPPLITPEHIAPEWHVLPFFAMLRAVPEKTLGVVMVAAALAMWLMPSILDRGPARPFWTRPVMRWAARFSRRKR